jgi:hypothetical protein
MFGVYFLKNEIKKLIWHFINIEYNVFYVSPKMDNGQ